MKIQPSPIHGSGVFADALLPDGYALLICEKIRQSRYHITFERGEVARFLNHSDRPNCTVQIRADGFWLCTRKPN
jgi:hypothetical protein